MTGSDGAKLMTSPLFLLGVVLDLGGVAGLVYGLAGGEAAPPAAVGVGIGLLVVGSIVEVAAVIRGRSDAS